MSRHLKTSKNNRISYIYYTAEGMKITLTPGENGVTESDIELLHTMDDAEVDEQRRFEYHSAHLDTYRDGENEKADDYDKRLADDRFEPGNILLEKEDEREEQTRIDDLRRAMDFLQPQQLELFRKVYVDKRTNTDIAAEEGVTEAAIRNRMKKIHEKLRKHFS